MVKFDHESSKMEMSTIRFNHLKPYRYVYLSNLVVVGTVEVLLWRWFMGKGEVEIIWLGIVAVIKQHLTHGRAWGKGDWWIFVWKQHKDENFGVGSRT